MIGDPPWMAPEQFKPGTPATPAADIWTLGLLAFWMLTGRSYWKRAADPNAAIKAQLREIVRDPLERASARAAAFGLAERLPPWVDAWFERCVTRAPSERYPDAREALRELEKASDLEDTETTAETSAAIATEPTTETIEEMAGA